jgi:hypothetical protein
MTVETSVEPLDQLVVGAMEALAGDRPLFHSEADFQLALAWQIQRRHPHARLRLEQRVLRDPVIALDVVVRLERRTYALELKYLKTQLRTTVDGERYELATGAPDIERYDLLKDVVRVERVVDHGVADAGCALVLTNAAGLWSPSSTGRRTGFDRFRVHADATLSGVLEWGETAGSGTRSGREDPIALRGEYGCRWRPYSHVAATTGGELRYLAFIVAPRGAEASAT